MPQYWSRTPWGVVWHRVAETECRNENVTSAELDDFLFEHKDHRKKIIEPAKESKNT
jgi:hypothetical protein